MDSSGPGGLVWAEWRQRIASRSAQAQQRWRSGWQPRLRRLFAVQQPAQSEPVPARDSARLPESDASPRETEFKSEAAQLDTVTPPMHVKVQEVEGNLAPQSAAAPQSEGGPQFEEKPQSEEGPQSEPEPQSEVGPHSKTGLEWEQDVTESDLEPSPQPTQTESLPAEALDTEQESTLPQGPEQTESALTNLPTDKADDKGAMMATDANAESSDGSESKASAAEPSLRAGSAPLTPLLAVPATTPEGSLSSARRSPLTVQDWVDSLPVTPCAREVSGGGEGSGRGAALAREASLVSEAGSQSSVESLLGLRRADPEEVLLGLGFGGAGGDLDDDLARIPRRFLRPSQVRGVAIQDFLRHQHDLVHTFESGSLGYRGLVGPGSRPASGIVGKIMEKLRGQRAPFQAAAGNTRFAAAARRVINTLPVTVLSPGNREYLDQQGGKSPEVPRKRMVIGQRSFAFDREGHLIDLGSDSGSDGVGSSLSRSDTLGSEPIARRLSFPNTETPPPTPEAPDAPGGWSPLAQRRRRSLKRQPRIDDQDETSPDRRATRPGAEPQIATSTPSSKATRLEMTADSSLELIDATAELSLVEAVIVPEVADKPSTEKAHESLEVTPDPLDSRETNAEPALESPTLLKPVQKWLRRDSGSVESAPRSLEWVSEPTEPLDHAAARRDSGRAADSLYLRERAAMHQVPQLRILVDTVVERHSAENRARPDNGTSEDGSPGEGERQDSEDRDGDVSDWDESMGGIVDNDLEVTDADWAMGRGTGRLQVLLEESEFGSDTNSVSSSFLEEALTAGDASAARRARLAGLGPSDSSGFSDQEDSLDQLSQELKRRGVEPGPCAAKTALAAFGAALGCADGCTPACSDLREACPDLRQLRELRDAVAAQLRRVADLVDEQPEGVASVTAQIAELLRRQSRLARLPDSCAPVCCDGLLGVRDAHRNLESLVQRNSRELAEIRRLLQQLLPAQSQS